MDDPLFMPIKFSTYPAPDEFPHNGMFPPSSTYQLADKQRQKLINNNSLNYYKYFE